jgi:hypothetical protein
MAQNIFFLKKTNTWSGYRVYPRLTEYPRITDLPGSGPGSGNPGTGHPGSSSRFRPKTGNGTRFTPQSEMIAKWGLFVKPYLCSRSEHANIVVF